MSADLIAVRPYGGAGWKMHLAADRPKERGRMGLGNMVIRVIPLCRFRKDGSRNQYVRHTDHLIVGGPMHPKPWREAVEEMSPHSYVCEECFLRATADDEVQP